MVAVNLVRMYFSVLDPLCNGLVRTGRRSRSGSEDQTLKDPDSEDRDNRPRGCRAEPVTLNK